VATEKETTVIDDVLEPSVPVTPTRPRRVKISVAAVALVAVLAGGLAVATAGDKDPEPLALVAGSQGDALNERAAGAPAIAPMAAADSKMALDAPYWGGFEYQVKGDLPDFGAKGTAWGVVGPDVNRETVARWAKALGLSGTSEFRDGGWTIQGADAYFSVYPGDGWSVSFNRNPGERRSDAVSAASAERRARDLLAGLGVLEGEWRVQVFETEIGVGYACAEALKLREEETARPDRDAVVSSEPAVEPGAMPDCPPPPAPVKAQNVSFFPMVGGMRTEWAVWNVTVGSEGIENLYGSWVTFERGDEYKLRSVDAALEELRQGGRAVPMPMPMPPIEVGAVPPIEPATDPVATDSVGGGTSGSAGASGSAGPVSGYAGAGTAVAPDAPVAVDVAPARPAIAPYYPCPPEADCATPEPQVITITGVDLVLQPQGVWSGRESAPKTYLVPAYRFTGTFEDGSPWESTVVALHPDAIAPPPAIEDGAPVKGGETTTLPMPAPADTATTTAPAKPPVR
jgi:hypothetical protein